MTTDFTKFKNKVLKKKSVKDEYDSLSSEYEVIKIIIKHRLKKGWSQTDLAKAIGSRQPVISRLERGGGNPSLKTLSNIAKALDLKLKVSMQ